MEPQQTVVARKPDSGATTAFEHTYSAREMGEMMNTRPIELYQLNIGFQTRWYDCEYIEEMLRYIEKEANIDMLMTLITIRWRRQVDDHIPHVACYDTSERKWVPYVADLDKKLEEIKARVMEYRRHKEEDELLKIMWMQQFGGGAEDMAPSVPEQSKPAPAQPEPSPAQPTAAATTRVAIDSLPTDIQKKILVDQKVFDIFVEQLNTDTWSIVSKNKGVYCDALRFVCNYRGITVRETSREDFDKLLHLIVAELKDQPSLMSSMTRRKETASNKISRSYKCYESHVPRMEDEIWQLTQACKPIEESLQPVYDAMHD